MAKYLRFGAYAWIFLVLTAAYAIASRLIFPPNVSISLTFYGVLLPVEAGITLLLASAALSVAAFLEIALSKSGLGWKVLWSAVVLLLAEIGVVAYYFLGRKGLVEEANSRKK